MVPTDSDPIPSNYAINKVDQRDWVELWYFTREGCMEARTTSLSDDQESFAVTKDGSSGHAVFKPMNVSKPSSKAIPDGQLSWAQMSIGKAGLLKQMEKSGWATDYVQSLAMMYFELEVHTMRHRLYGEQTVILYADEVRREWSLAIKHTSAIEPFNIGRINEERLNKIYREVLNLQQTRTIAALEDCASNMSISKRGRSPSPPHSPEHPRPHQRHSSSRYNDRGQQQARSGRKASNFRGEPEAKRHRGDKDQGFRNDARDQPPRVYSPCTLCLGRHKHNVWSCASPTFWDLQPARCVK
ncbi:hypothetical protein BKA70DRAFT_1384924, partial [Coprinopsis sp. MPI-PUGE-AT-0042]